MRDILISSAVCVACLLLAFVSQLVSPSTVQAAAPRPSTTATMGVPASMASASVPSGRLELDPDDSNPSLFSMAPDSPPRPTTSWPRPVPQPSVARWMPPRNAPPTRACASPTW